MFGRKKDDDIFDIYGELVVYNADKRTVDRVPIDDISDTHVTSTGRYSVPKEDLSIHVSTDGTVVYTLEAPEFYVQETERLAKLERSIVLTQITQFKPPVEDNPNTDMRFWALAVLLFVAIIASVF